MRKPLSDTPCGSQFDWNGETHLKIAPLLVCNQPERPSIRQCPIVLMRNGEVLTLPAETVVDVWYEPADLEAIKAQLTPETGL